MTEIQGFQEIQAHINSQMFNLKEQLLDKIIKQCLERDYYFLEEVKRFQLVTHARCPGREFIGFDGGLIGEIVMFQREEDFQIKMGYEFIPKTKIDFE